MVFSSTKYNMSDRIVSDIQCRAEGETFYIQYNTVAHIVLCLWNEKHAFICSPKGIRPVRICIGFTVIFMWLKLHFWIGLLLHELLMNFITQVVVTYTVNWLHLLFNTKEFSASLTSDNSSQQPIYIINPKWRCPGIIKTEIHLKYISTFSSKFWNQAIISDSLAPICRKSGGSL